MIHVDNETYNLDDMIEVKEDIHNILDQYPDEADAVLTALNAGRIEGDIYIHMEGPSACGCLIGTIAIAKSDNKSDRDMIIASLKTRVKEDKITISYEYRASEIWFMNIHLGDTPANNEHAAYAVKWIEEWMKAHGKEMNS